MKVLHLLDTLAMGGKEAFTVALAGAQKRAGMRPGLATFDPGNAFTAELEDAGLPWRSYSRHGAVDWSLAKALRKLLVEEEYALVHCHGENPAMYGALAVLGRKLPLVVTVHSGDRDALRLVIKIQNRLAYARADRIVCVSESIRQSLLTREFAPSRKTVTIGNGIVPPRAPDAARLERLRAELDLGPRNTVALCVGRLVPVKNHLKFLEAFAAARAQAEGLVLVMAGAGPLGEQVAAKVRELGLQTDVRLLGERKDVGHLLALADIFALPSLNEGHSISLLEACSFGKAILASDRGGNPSIVSPGISGLLVEPEDIAGMAAGLVRLARDPELRAKLGAGAYQVYADRYGMEPCLNAYARLYAQLSPAFRSGP